MRWPSIGPCVGAGDPSAPSVPARLAFGVLRAVRLSSPGPKTAEPDVVGGISGPGIQPGVPQSHSWIDSWTSRNVSYHPVIRMHSHAPAILDRLSSLADPTRSRILLLLDRHELTVSELCAIMQLPQSTISRHLKALADAGWVTGRAEGTSDSTSMATDDLRRQWPRRLWLLVREQVGSTAAAAEDQRRLQSALADRRTKSQEFFSTSAGQWDRLRDELFGERFHLSALAALASPDWVVGDLGCGTGQVSAALAPFVRRVVAVDSSAAMLQAARKRLDGLDNVDFRLGELEALPIDDGAARRRDADAGAPSCARAREGAASRWRAC